MDDRILSAQPTYSEPEPVFDDLRPKRERCCINRSVLFLGAYLFFFATGCDGLEPQPSNQASIPNPQQLSPEQSEDLSTESTVVRQVKPTSPNDPIEVQVSYDKQVTPGDKVVVTIAFDVQPGYELQAFTTKPPKQPTRVEFRLPPGWIPDGELKIPEPMRSRILGNGPSYSGQFKCQQVLRSLPEAEVQPEHSLQCVVSYQACDDKKCLRPIEAALELHILVKE